MAHYGTIDPWSGHVFWIGEADSPEDACRKTDIEAGIYDRQFRYASACPPYANTSGFVVYELPGPAPEALRLPGGGALLREHGLHEEREDEPRQTHSLCVVCGVAAVTPEFGEDTCRACFSRIRRGPRSRQLSPSGFRSPSRRSMSRSFPPTP